MASAKIMTAPVFQAKPAAVTAEGGHPHMVQVCRQLTSAAALAAHEEHSPTSEK
jgi:hypothetical protein